VKFGSGGKKLDGGTFLALVVDDQRAHSHHCQQQGASNIEIEGSGSLVMMLSLASARPLIASEDFDAEVKERMR
jgi:hypothetical protein